MPRSDLHAPVTDWYTRAARDLPWRRPGTTPWGVLVSEVMLQQTPVARVVPVWQRWVQRWPEPAGLAAAAPGEAVRGAALPAPALTAAERRLAEQLLPDDPAAAATWSVAVMELGALVCTARGPRCGQCPVVDRCRWHLAGRPAATTPVRRSQPWAGTDRMVRGRLLAVLRDADRPVAAAELAAAWHDEEQRERCLATLVADGLAELRPGGTVALPGGAP